MSVESLLIAVAVLTAPAYNTQNGRWLPRPTHHSLFLHRRECNLCFIDGNTKGNFTIDVKHWQIIVIQATLINYNQVLAHRQHSASRTLNTFHGLRVRTSLLFPERQMFVTKPVRDKVTCDTCSQSHLHGVMTNVCKHAENHTWKLCVNSEICTHTHVIYVNTYTHTYAPCVRIRKHVHTHIYYLCTYTWTHTHTHGKPLSIYVNIYTHTCRLCAPMCKSARPRVKFPSTPRPPPIAYCCRPSPWKNPANTQLESNACIKKTS